MEMGQFQPHWEDSMIFHKNLNQCLHIYCSDRSGFTMRCLLLFIPFLLLLSVLFTDCGYPSFDVTIPKADVERDLRKKFPISKTYAGIVEVTLRDPSLELGKNKNRLNIGVNAVISPRSLQGAELSKGTITFSSGLAFDKRTAVFLLDSVIVDSIGLDLGPLDQGVKNGIITVIRELEREKLEGAPVYHLNERDIRRPIAKLFLRKVTIRKDAIVVTLGF